LFDPATIPYTDCIILVWMYICSALKETMHIEY
jgi:hypothetical protein